MVISGVGTVCQGFVLWVTQSDHSSKAKSLREISFSVLYKAAFYDKLKKQINTLGVSSSKTENHQKRICFI